MSDVSQGPGWWEASDGKWYPPHQHPDYAGSEEPAGEAQQEVEQLAGIKAAISTAITSADGPPPAWYDNPLGEGLRYWDGSAWTQHFARPATGPVPSRRGPQTVGEPTDLVTDNGLGWILVST